MTVYGCNCASWPGCPCNARKEQAEVADSRDKAKKIIADLNDRSGVNIDFDDDIMEEIYEEIAEVIES